ncbi:DUF4357 domain-containing protein [Taylorella equigenitalis]|uniref:DUF4357 domain-containing protein n=1 Tax=Taylorella equigenitalis TaxID=29575 RepID=UPI0004215EDC|nr:DUF4357 domain-containing protein [Taylorella equigenitalis]WDU46583.1 DUF4357 domain-containing protein [Taylorella equigenitalis]
MAKGVIYVMSTVIDGVVKIGRSNQFNSRRRQLEKNGYMNVGGLKTQFAIEVTNFEEKEKLLQDIFSKSRIDKTELFALDVDLVKLLLATFEGKQIFPNKESKEEIVIESRKSLDNKAQMCLIPNGIYTMSTRIRSFGEAKAKARVEDGVFTLLKGSTCAPLRQGVDFNLRNIAKISDQHILEEDLVCSSPSAATQLVRGQNSRGWKYWKNKDGELIDIYRKKST